jgi:hypothetical protein
MTCLHTQDVLAQDMFIISKVLFKCHAFLFANNSGDVRVEPLAGILDLEKIEHVFIEARGIVIISVVFFVAPKFQDIVQEIVEILHGNELSPEVHGVFIIKAGQYSHKNDTEYEKDGYFSPNGFYYETPSRDVGVKPFSFSKKKCQGRAVGLL